MPLYIPWLTETIKKRGVRYLLHHYLGQFFDAKLTLEQLSIDIYEGKGSIRNLALDVDGLNDELDFIPFKFLDGCLIGQISVEVPWSSLATEACRVELEGAKFVCRLKTSADGSKTHCTESTLLSRSLMTSSMQMAEDIVTTEDDDDYDSPNSSVYKQQRGQDSSSSRKKDANQMFEGLEMFAQLIDSVLRRTKLTARNTLFQIQAHPDSRDYDRDEESGETKASSSNDHRHQSSASTNDCNRSSTSGDEFGEPSAKSDGSDDLDYENSSEGTVEFFIKFFRCEEIMDRTRNDFDSSPRSDMHDDESSRQPLSAMPETITKLLTLEDVEMRIGGKPVSNLVGKHTIMIKFNGQKSEISIFSGSPLLAVIGHRQLKTFFNVFDSAKDRENESSPVGEKIQKVMSPEDYAKIENQLLESATLRTAHNHVQMSELGYVGLNYHNSSQSGRKWVDSGDLYSNLNDRQMKDTEYDYHSPNSSSTATCLDGKSPEIEPSLDNIEAFSCELKLPGIWLCILRDGETLPPLIKPYADSINSFQTINKYIDEHIKVPHIRILALKVALDITTCGINVFLGDLDISEHLQNSSMNPILHLLHNDLTNLPMSSSRYKASIVNNRNITVDLLTKTRIIFDPTIIDRIVYDYKLINIDRPGKAHLRTKACGKQRTNHTDINLTIRGQQFKVELLCPIPDLTPEAQSKPTQLRPQSFLFDFENIIVTWQSDKLKVVASELVAFVKTQPQQADNEAVKFIESIGKSGEKIVLTLEPSPSSLDNEFPNEVEQALNESSMYDSIYVSQATESRIPKEAFQTKRKVVRASSQAQTGENHHQQRHHQQVESGGKTNDCDNEKILTPGDRQHLLEYLNQTVASTSLSLSLHLPSCEIEFEDKEQLDLIYNRFGNDFVFWQPRAFSANDKPSSRHHRSSGSGKRFRRKKFNLRQHRNADQDLDEEDEEEEEDNDGEEEEKRSYYRQPISDESNDGGDRDDEDDDDELGSEVSFHSLSNEGSSSYSYDNEVTCKIVVDELFVRFNHQSCASALKQEIVAENLLLGVVIDVNRKPNTILSLVADNLELSTDLETVLEGNSFGDKNSIFSLTAEIKRPTKALKDIKLAIQLVNGLFNDFKTDTYTRFWQSINVTDEPILGYIAPKIVTELHVDTLNTSLSLVRDGARPALLSIDELYLTSMVMEQTSQVMIRLIADEVSLYLKRNKQGLEIMKNYICLIDSGLIDLDVKFSQDGRLEFGVINNVITVRACQDSLSALCKLFNALIRSGGNGGNAASATAKAESQPASGGQRVQVDQKRRQSSGDLFNESSSSMSDDCDSPAHSTASKRLAGDCDRREMNLLEDAMNDFSGTELASEKLTPRAETTTKDNYGTEEESGEEQEEAERDEDEASESKSSDVDDDAGDDDDDEDDNDDEDDDQDDEDNDEDERDESEESDSDSPLAAQCSARAGNRRDPNACLLDESNPLLGDILSQPLIPLAEPLTIGQRQLDHSANSSATATSDPLLLAQSLQRAAIDESGFFVIGDDDVGAGIMDKLQHEPMVRKLIQGPINIIDNHFKMTKPRTIPEMLAASLHRYVLEEMTLVVNLYGGRDFDDEQPKQKQNQNQPADGSSSPTGTLPDDGSQTADACELLDAPETVSMRSRTGSVASATSRRSPLSRKHCASDSQSQQQQQQLNLQSARAKRGARRKHLSEGCNHDSYLSAGQSRHTANEQHQQRVRFGDGTVNLWESLDLMSAPDFLGTNRRPSQPQVSSDSKLAGGTWRQSEVCIQLTLTKVKLLYELADSSSPISWRFMLFIQDIEIKDRIQASDINKMLYEYCTESMPKRNTQILTIKNVATINPSDGCEECDLRVSLKPLRLNVDQDTLLFLIEFFTAFGKSIGKQQQQQSRQPAKPAGVYSQSSTESSARTSSISSSSGAQQPSARRESANRSAAAAAAAAAATAKVVAAQSTRSDNCRDSAASNRSSRSSSISSSSANAAGAGTTTTIGGAAGVGGQQDGGLPTHCHAEGPAGSANQQPIYIKSFTFSPDVPIRLDYHAKHLDFEQGALAGILMGLAHLDHSELVLRRVQAKHGMRGLDRVVLFTINAWLSDIKRNQLPSILGGVGPMHSFIQLFQGVRDLVWLPIDHYRRDKRLVRGLQRGATSFSSSTAMAAINLVNRFISIVQCTAQIAHDIVTPPGLQSPASRRSGAAASSGSGESRASRRRIGGVGGRSPLGRGALSGGLAGSPSSASAALNQPRNFCEGVAVGFTILKEGFNDTARNVAVGMQADDVRSAVGELVRQIPSTLLNPIISATEGAQNVLVGIRNQIAPDARREDQEKWKRRVRGR